HRLDLVVAEHVPLQRALAKHRQIAVRHERRQTDDGVVSPIRPAVALPPGAADCVGAHAQSHAELKDAGKGTRGRHTDDQAWHDAEAGLHLHHAHQLEHELHGHDAVGIEHDCEIVVPAPAPAEVGDITRLETNVAGATA